MGRWGAAHVQAEGRIHPIHPRPSILHPSLVRPRPSLVRPRPCMSMYVLSDAVSDALRPQDAPPSSRERGAVHRLNCRGPNVGLIAPKCRLNCGLFFAQQRTGSRRSAVGTGRRRLNYLFERLVVDIVPSHRDHHVRGINGVPGVVRCRRPLRHEFASVRAATSTIRRSVARPFERTPPRPPPTASPHVHPPPAPSPSSSQKKKTRPSLADSGPRASAASWRPFALSLAPFDAARHGRSNGGRVASRRARVTAQRSTHRAHSANAVSASSLPKCILFLL